MFHRNSGSGYAPDFIHPVYGGSFHDAADAGDPSGGAAQANSLLASMTAFNMQNYYIDDVSESDKEANQFWLRYAQPFSIGESNWLRHPSQRHRTH